MRAENEVNFQVSNESTYTLAFVRPSLLTLPPQNLVQISSAMTKIILRHVLPYGSAVAFENELLR